MSKIGDKTKVICFVCEKKTDATVREGTPLLTQSGETPVDHLDVVCNRCGVRVQIIPKREEKS